MHWPFLSYCLKPRKPRPRHPHPHRITRVSGEERWSRMLKQRTKQKPDYVQRDKSTFLSYYFKGSQVSPRDCVRKASSSSDGVGGQAVTQHGSLQLPLIGLDVVRAPGRAALVRQCHEIWEATRRAEHDNNSQPASQKSRHQTSQSANHPSRKAVTQKAREPVTQRASQLARK